MARTSYRTNFVGLPWRHALALIGACALVLVGCGQGAEGGRDLDATQCPTAGFDGSCFQVGAGDTKSMNVWTTPRLAANSPVEHPVLVLIGGPGLSARWEMGSILAAAADVLPADLHLTVDFAGTAAVSELSCPDSSLQRDLELLHARNAEDVVALSTRYADDCPAELGAAISLATFGSAANVEALETIREELGFERWSIVAQSYGTRVAIAYAAAHPDRVEALVLDAPVEIAPTVETWQARSGAFTKSLRTGLDWCANDGPCRARFTQHPADVYADLIQELDASPANALGTVGFSLIVAGLIQDPMGRGTFLELLATTERRGTMWLADEVGSPHADARLNEAAYHATECQDWRWSSVDPKERATSLMDDMPPDGMGVQLRDLACAYWPSDGTPLDVRSRSDVRTVVIESDADWAAPMGIADGVLGPNTARVVVRGGPHGSIGWGDPCVTEAVRRALADSNATPLTECEVPWAELPNPG